MRASLLPPPRHTVERGIGRGEVDQVTAIERDRGDVSVFEGASLERDPVRLETTAEAGRSCCSAKWSRAAGRIHTPTSPDRIVPRSLRTRFGSRGDDEASAQPPPSRLLQVAAVPSHRRATTDCVVCACTTLRTELTPDQTRAGAWNSGSSVASRALRGVRADLASVPRPIVPPCSRSPCANASGFHWRPPSRLVGSPPSPAPKRPHKGNRYPHSSTRRCSTLQEPDVAGPVESRSTTAASGVGNRCSSFTVTATK